MVQFTITGQICEIPEPFFIQLKEAEEWVEEERCREIGAGGSVMPFLCKQFGFMNVVVSGHTAKYRYDKFGETINVTRELRL